VTASTALGKLQSANILGIDIRMRMESGKFSVNKKVVHFGIQRSGSLLKTIQIFLKGTNKARVIMEIARRLFHVYFLLQIPMQGGIFNIHLMDLPFM
jgi:hypothetical protein